MAPLGFLVLAGPLPSRSPASGHPRCHGLPRGLPASCSQVRPHTSQGPGLQLASSCRARRDMREKALAQLLHWYLLVPECVCRWARRLERSAKALLQ